MLSAGDDNNARYLDLLLRTQLVDIGRAANIIWFSFANTPIVNEPEEKDRIANNFALHVQCPCRMVDKEKKEILFASSDIYVPNSETEWSEDFEWDIQGANRYDEQAKKWLSLNRSVFVEKLNFNVLGDLKLLLSNGHVFEALVASSSDNECWRFFEVNSKQDHFVVTGKRAIFEYEIE